MGLLTSSYLFSYFLGVVLNNCWLQTYDFYKFFSFFCFYYLLFIKVSIILFFYWFIYLFTSSELGFFSSYCTSSCLCFLFFYFYYLICQFLKLYYSFHLLETHPEFPHPITSLIVLLYVIVLFNLFYFLFFFPT